MSRFTITVFILAALVSCGREDDVRRYVETSEGPAVSGSPSQSRAVQPGSRLTWQVPRGWEEKEGTGMRMATILTGEKEKPATCTVIGLKGDGGGVAANIIRWLNQLNLSSEFANEEALNNFISSQQRIETGGGLSGLFVDFTLLSPLPTDLSMLVTIFQLSDRTVFIKMMEEKSVLNRYRKGYLELIRSVRTVGEKQVEKE